MNVLALFDIELWFTKACIQIYSWAGDVYKFIINLATNSYLTEESISNFKDNLAVFLGIFMLFKLAISLINYLIDPDKMDDKKTGTSSLIVGVVTMLAILLLYSQVFQLMRNLQNWILGTSSNGENVILQIFGGQEEKDEKTHAIGFTCTYSNYKRALHDEGALAVISFQNNAGGYPVYLDRRSNVVIAGDLLDAKSFKGFSIAKAVWVEKSGKTSHFGYTGIVLRDKPYEVLHTNEELNTSPASCPKYFGVAGPFAYFSEEENAPETWNVLTSELLDSKELTYINDAGRTFSGMILFSFISCVPSEANNACQEYYKDVENNNFASLADYMDEDNEENYGMSITGGGFLPLLFGVVLLLFLITTTVDVAIRSIKLTILELFAPIPIMCYADPSTRETFNSWLKTTMQTYFDLFIRVIAIAIVNFMVANIKGMNFSSVENIVMVLGLLLFLKEAPQFICKMLGIKDTGSLKGFTLNPFAKLAQVPVVGGAMGAVGGAIGGAAGGFKTGGMMGGLMGAFSGGSAGWKNNGGGMGREAGKKPQNGSFAVGGKAGTTFMRGEGGFMSQQVGARATRAYVGNDKFKADEDTKKAAYYSSVSARETAERNLARSQALYEDAKSKGQIGTMQALSTRIVQQTSTLNAAKAIESSANTDYQISAKAREKAQKISPDKPDTARKVRYK